MVLRNCVSMAFSAETMDSIHLEAAGTSLGNKGGGGISVAQCILNIKTKLAEGITSHGVQIKRCPYTCGEMSWPLPHRLMMSCIGRIPTASKQGQEVVTTAPL